MASKEEMQRWYEPKGLCVCFFFCQLRTHQSETRLAIAFYLHIKLIFLLIIYMIFIDLYHGNLKTRRSNCVIKDNETARRSTCGIKDNKIGSTFGPKTCYALKSKMRPWFSYCQKPEKYMRSDT